MRKKLCVQAIKICSEKSIVKSTEINPDKQATKMIFC